MDQPFASSSSYRLSRQHIAFRMSAQTLMFSGLFLISCRERQ
jgi:hypothetical protein